MVLKWNLYNFFKAMKSQLGHLSIALVDETEIILGILGNKDLCTHVAA